MKGKKTTICVLLLLLTGLSLLLYPTVSDCWNRYHQTRAIASYSQTVSELEEKDYQKLWQDAGTYNDNLSKKQDRYHLSGQEQKEYEALLNAGGNGIMGSVEIPKLSVLLPVYHGTDEATLQVAVGHMPGTSLPVGGSGSHCVLTGHSGLPSARLFTDLDKMEEGDVFFLHVLDETLQYEVDQIEVVLPEELEELSIVTGEDYCTLVTCTPYGVNSHRLLVRGRRTEPEETQASVSEGTLIDDEQHQGAGRVRTYAAIFGVVLSAVLLVWIIRGVCRKRKKNLKESPKERR